MITFLPVIIQIYSLVPEAFGSQVLSVCANSTCFYEEETKNPFACPSWFYCNTSNQCECGKDHDGIIKCDQARLQAKVVDCYCVTYDEQKKMVVAGACFLNCASPRKGDLVDTVYHALNKSVSELNKVCGSKKRTGALCGKCMDEYYPLAYSYNHSCIKCSGLYGKWWKYILVAYVPLTVFYIIVLFFKINVTSSHLHAFVIYSQAVSMPANVRVLLSSAPFGYK